MTENEQSKRDSNIAGEQGGALSPYDTDLPAEAASPSLADPMPPPAIAPLADPIPGTERVTPAVERTRAAARAADPLAASSSEPTRFAAPDWAGGPSPTRSVPWADIRASSSAPPAPPVAATPEPPATPVAESISPFAAAFTATTPEPEPPAPLAASTPPAPPAPLAASTPPAPPAPLAASTPPAPPVAAAPEPPATSADLAPEALTTSAAESISPFAAAFAAAEPAPEPEPAPPVASAPPAPPAAFAPSVAPAPEPFTASASEAPTTPVAESTTPFAAAFTATTPEPEFEPEPEPAPPVAYAPSVAPAPEPFTASAPETPSTPVAESSSPFAAAFTAGTPEPEPPAPEPQASDEWLDTRPFTPDSVSDTAIRRTSLLRPEPSTPTNEPQLLRESLEADPRIENYGTIFTPDDALFEGAEYDRVPSRTAAHIWGVVAMLLLVPVAWYLIADAGARMTLPENAQWTTGTMNMAALLELLAGILVLVVALLFARASSLGAFVVGSLFTLAGSVFVVAPKWASTLMGPIQDSLKQLHAGLGGNISHHLEASGSTGRLLALGVTLIMVGAVSHSARKRGRKEQRIQAAVDRRRARLEP